MFNSNYILQQKKYLYDKLKEIIKESKNNEFLGLEESESQLNINQINNFNNKIY